MDRRSGRKYHRLATYVDEKKEKKESCYRPPVPYETSLSSSDASNYSSLGGLAGDATPTSWERGRV